MSIPGTILKIAISQIRKNRKKTINQMEKINQEERNTIADKSILNHVLWSMGAGMIPISLVDILAVSGVQLDMIHQLCKVYDVDFNETEGKAYISSLVGSSLPRIGASLIKMLPVVGTFMGGVSMIVLSGASTYALGEVFKKHFASGGTFLDFEVDRFKKYYDEKFEKGKDVAKDFKEEDEKRKKAEAAKNYSEPSVKEETKKTVQKDTSDATAKKPEENEVVRKLKELADLHKAGILTDEEFGQMKKRLIENYLQ
jgi:uncharacterized protein (DUF697 family)